ncbi:MAG: DUF4162 domain-containing protein, partial [Oscillospiraceae bacterium]|nr:DUF4162 domain-containing protein [Oscillospiraceae bacterium]
GNLAEIKRNYVRDKLVVRTINPQPILDDFGNSCKTTENGDLIIKLASPADKKETMKRLIETYDIDEVRVFEPSLNDIFIEYAGNSNDEEVAK